MFTAVYANNVSRGTFARKLALRLGIRTLTPKGSRDLCSNRSGPPILLNWGSSEHIEISRYPIVWAGNTPDAVKAMSNKLHMFQAFTSGGITSLRWCQYAGKAREWLKDGFKVYERHMLTGHSGVGIVVINPGEELSTPAPRLYTRGVAGKFREYRIHVVDGTVIAVQLKRIMGEDKITERGFGVPDNAERRVVRTYKNGWVFCINDFEWPEAGVKAALDTIMAVKAVTGAVDIMIDIKNHVTVIETNSAPALRSPTVIEKYIVALTTLITNKEEEVHGNVDRQG